MAPQDDLTAEQAAALLGNIVGIVPMTEQQRATRVQWLVDYAKTARQEALREAYNIVNDWPLGIEDRLGLLDRLASEGGG